MFDKKLREGVSYFERMLKVMPDDRTTLEFLAVAYPKTGETAKAELVLADLARVLLNEGDIEHAEALLPRLEACAEPRARQMAVRIRASSAPRPELVPETAADAPDPEAGLFAEACDSEARFADGLGEGGVAAQLRAMSDSGRASLVSALYFLEREKSDSFEGVVAKLCDEYREPPVPLDGFTPDRELMEKLGEDFVRIRGVVPFARLGTLVLVAYLSPHDAELRKRVERSLGTEARFYLATPEAVEKAVESVWPKEGPKA